MKRREEKNETFILYRKYKYILLENLSTVRLYPISFSMQLNSYRNPFIEYLYSKRTTTTIHLLQTHIISLKSYYEIRRMIVAKSTSEGNFNHRSSSECGERREWGTRVEAFNFLEISSGAWIFSKYISRTIFDQRICEVCRVCYYLLGTASNRFSHLESRDFIQQNETSKI